MKNTETTILSSTATLEALPTAEKDKEVHNSLTRHFTVAEWDALKMLRASSMEPLFAYVTILLNGFALQGRLPEIHRLVYGTSNDKTQTFTLWGVSVDVSRPESDARVSVILMKFLRAKYVHVCRFKRQGTGFIYSS